MSESASTSQEIIIVRRSNNDGDGGHHGGAWKIAYADFVTAMMAFFLVMWLINSANEVTKSRVASYFNPIKMTDASPSGRGLKSPVEKKPTESPKSETEGQNGKTKEKVNENSEFLAEDKLLQSPFSAMDEIVSKASGGFADGERDIANRTVGDPFDPKAWEALRNGQQNDAKELAQIAKEQETGKLVNGLVKEEVPQPKDQVAETDLQLRPSKDVRDNIFEDKPGPGEKVDQETMQVEKTLKDIVDKHKAEIDVSVKVRKTDEGLLIMLGDNSGQGMFAIGSAKPNAGLIDVVGVIGRLLSQQQGDVVIRGHTDNRAYKTKSHDNWQLSTSRAHMASYMLRRGGLAESRIKRIEGHGSATPLISTDPLADANRRVEFLLTTESK